jgi:hypothetical protein
MSHGKLSKRLLLRVLLISGALTAVFTSIQVTLDYYSRIDNFKAQLEDTVSELAYGIAAAVRVGDTPTIAGVTSPITSFSEKTAIIISRDNPDLAPGRAHECLNIAQRPQTRC